MSLTSKFTKKDFYFSIVTGLITGVFAWQIFDFLVVPIFHLGEPRVICGIVSCFTQYSYPISWIWLVVTVPIFWILGVLLGYFLGQWLKFFNQFGKFAAIGFTNAAVDFGVLNLLIANTGISSGVWYPVFKGISFVCAIVPSYFWNKYWAFEAKEGGGGFEFAKFISVAIFAILINTGTASLVVNYINPIGGLSVQVWANVGAVAGSAVALVFSFIGFKVAVFKK